MTTARAERDVHVDVVAGAPVSAGELAAALRVRIAPAGAPLVVRIRRTDDGVVAEIDHRSRAVRLGGLTGGDAARLIALAIEI